jgi:putative tryptophan/tyrosine transport system substrate-binding protein
LTVWMSLSTAALQFMMRLVLACACLALVPAQAAAARVAVVLSEDTAPYQEIYQVIRAYLDDGPHEARRIYAEDLSASSLDEARLVVAVGVRAAESLAAQPLRSPVLAVLVPRAWYVKTGHASLGRADRGVASAIFIDQPFDRQARLLRLALPDVKRVGVLLSAGQGGLANELNAALRTQQLAPVHGTLAPGERLIPSLESVLSGADVLLAVPDPQVFNRSTAQSLFLTSYRYRVPVLGYSHSLTRAGALLSLHSSPAQIGRQTAEWVSAAIKDAEVVLPSPAHPAYFSVSVNEQVARSLGFALPPAAELEQRLGGGR